ncbi:hypothetical protein HMPREF9374_3458 [Desmospora sp. 8437]|nr:hypothetical protein HMPREF9374_3458 [Desmospora sp. 8437]
MFPPIVNHDISYSLLFNGCLYREESRERSENQRRKEGSGCRSGLAIVPIAADRWIVWMDF